MKRHFWAFMAAACLLSVQNTLDNKWFLHRKSPQHPLQVHK